MAEKKTVLITGCSPGGIGHSLALNFHSHGLRVFATARKAEALQDLADKGIETLDLEVDKTASIQAARQKVEALTGGKLDYLVNNAGRNYTVPALDVELDEIRTTFEANVFGVMRMCQEFAPLLIASKGTVVQIGSVAAIMPYVFGSVYNASKAALHQYSNTLRVELAPFDVKVVTIVTGGVKSRIARTERALPAGSLYEPINTDYQRRLKHSQEVGMPNEDYARSVVNQVLKRNPPRHIWQGAASYLVYFMQFLLPRSLQEFVFYRMFGLAKLVGTASKLKHV